MVDSWEVWDDYKPFALRPLGERSVSGVRSRIKR